MGICVGTGIADILLSAGSDGASPRPLASSSRLTLTCRTRRAYDADMRTPLPDELIVALQSSPAQVFCHEIVMDAIDLSMALDRHVLLYGLEGLFLLENDEAAWRLPPTRAAWIPAGTEMTATTIKQVRCTSLFFHPSFAQPLSAVCRIFDANPVLREMIIYARRWSTHSDTIQQVHGEQVERFFLTLLDLCREQLQPQYQLALPKARTDETKRALDFIREYLSEPIRLEDVAEYAAMSPRTLQRKLDSEIHMTWRDFLRHARMIRGMEYLARGNQVTETAFDAGYTSVAAFSTAFHRFTGMTPTEYMSKF